MTLKIYFLTSLLMFMSISAHAAGRCATLFGKTEPVFTNSEKIDWQVWRDDVPVRIKTVMDSEVFGGQDITIGRAEFPGLGDGLPYHRHSHPELYQIIKGQAKIIINGIEHRANPGQVVILPGNAMHTIINGGRTPLEIEYYFPSNSLHEVTYEYPKKLTSTQAFSARLHEKYVVSAGDTPWMESKREGVVKRGLVTRGDRVELKFSQLKMHSNSQPLKIKSKDAQTISVKSGIMNLKFGNEARELNEGEMVFIRPGSSVSINPVGGRTLQLDIVKRDHL